MQGMQIQTLIRELRSHMLCGKKKKKKQHVKLNLTQGLAHTEGSVIGDNIGDSDAAAVVDVKEGSLETLEVNQQYDEALDCIVGCGNRKERSGLSY